MIVYCLRCPDCGTERVGRKEPGGNIEPLVEPCPVCGVDEYTVPALE